MKRFWAGVAVALVVLFVGCGDDTQSSGEGSNGGEEPGEVECQNSGDCPGAGECTDEGECHCPGGEVCGGDEICCGEGERCDEGSGSCEALCTGEVCGFEGDLCCEGEEPVCGPDGRCAPACEEGAPLCGEEFDECCEVGDVCVFGACIEPGETCEDFRDCGFDEYCDGAVGRCLPDDFPEDLVCEVALDFDPFEIDELWHWEGEELDRLYSQVQSIPVTADLIDNGSPEVVITPYWGDQPSRSDDQHNAVLVVLDGASGETLYVNEERTFSGQGHPAVGDVTGDGKMEIIAVFGEDSGGGIGMIKNPEECDDPAADDDDCFGWIYNEGNLSGVEGGEGMGPVLADLDGNGEVEVVMGSTVLNGATGALIAQGPYGSRGFNGPHGSWGSPTVADVMGNGSLEILTGGCAGELDRGEGELVQVWCNDDFSDGTAGVADVVSGDGRAGLPEVVSVRNGVVYVLDGQNGETLHSIDIPGGGQGGPPNLADFDGDGTVEIGLPGEQCYSVFDVACIDGVDGEGSCDQPEFPDCTPGDDCLVDPCDAGGLDDGSGEGVLWSIEVQDRSEATGSSVFDFQGNGRNEVVYNDECRLLVLDGQSGQPLIARMNTTRTATEYPLVVDVNGDGRTNLALIANNDQYNRDCNHFLDESSGNFRPDWFPECFPDDPDDRPARCDGGTEGIIILEDVHDAWVSTRQIWNQHAYYIDNINDDGSIPMVQDTHWESHNTFRANRQGQLPQNSPDVVVSSVQVNAQVCPPSISLQVTIENQGVAAIEAGLPVSVYVDRGGEEAVRMTTEELESGISPGGVATMNISYEVSQADFNQPRDVIVVANDDGEDGAPIRDCNPDRATGIAEGVECRIPL